MTCEKCKKLKAELTECYRNLENKNLALDAMHFVWCDGGCSSGVDRWYEERLTEELLLQAERNVQRMRRWWDNKEARKKYK
jgi:hypothetical protein